ncbi:hypothetical protein [Streptacidiphilus carbonis]|uniref:hypothetical protein n=1 Tax=Streptacidiphilus carbonis TaxID=105422 RepID=UPI0005AA5C00|nr:hypothetical protein [Streptacidiphilus carbonis]
MTGPDTGVGDLAPAAVGQEQALLPAARVQAPAGMGQDLVRSISEAAAAVRFVDATGSGAADISVTALTALVCTGDTEAAAMQAAADLTREVTPRMRLVSLAWATVPGPADGTWQWAVTMTVASRDPRTGEYVGELHHAPAAPVPDIPPTGE